ncbi:hypothetical protein BS78_05G126500 [Paspalum vaginatum]|nr:hypothetical protein BS78_05G126500 [Paspalum vaginatum]
MGVDGGSALWLVQTCSNRHRLRYRFVRRPRLHACMQRQADTAVKSPISHGNERLQGCRPRRWELMLCYKMLIMRGRGPFFVDYAPYAPWRP